jgi:hypothetical protein
VVESSAVGIQIEGLAVEASETTTAVGIHMDGEALTAVSPGGIQITEEPEGVGPELSSATAAVVAAAADSPSTRAATVVTRVVRRIRDIVVLESRESALTQACRRR